MTDQFQYVMVLVSIIIGLGITNALLGVSAAIDLVSEESRTVSFSWASAWWLAYAFLLMLLFWWWEFRLLDALKHWTLWNYFVVVSYAMLLFFLVALLVPRDWARVTDLDRYFLAKRRWFYGVLLAALTIDLADSFMKGGLGYVRATGPLVWGMNAFGVPTAAIGIRSTRIRTHAMLGFVYLVWQLAIGLDAFPLLHL